MTISEKLQKVNKIKDDIRTAVNQKGGNLSFSAPFEDYPDAIKNLPSGGGSNYNIHVVSEDPDMGEVSGGGSASEGMIVTVKAVPVDAGYALEGWYEEVDGEDEFQSGEREYCFKVNRDRNLVAKFGDAYVAGRGSQPF